MFFRRLNMMEVSAATAASPVAPWPAPAGPNSLPLQAATHDSPIHPRIPSNSTPLHHPPHPRLIPAPHRLPIRPFFVREIYKNGFLKRLAHNEKKSSALSKLMRSDRYWVVFSVHDLGPEQVGLSHQRMRFADTNICKLISSLLCANGPIPDASVYFRPFHNTMTILN